MSPPRSVRTTLGPDGGGVHQQVVQRPPRPQGEDVRVLEQEQVVVGRVDEQPVLEGVGVLVGDPPQPPDPQHHELASDSPVMGGE